MKVTRRQMLHATTLFVFGLGWPEIRGENSSRINVYVTQPFSPAYFKAAFDLSEMFLRTEVDLNIHFKHVKKYEVPALDDLSHLAIAEISPENMASIEFQKRKACDDFLHINDFLSWLDGLV